MKTQPFVNSLRRVPSRFMSLVAIAGVSIFTSSGAMASDVPTASASSFAGIYKVAASSDPMFPMSETCEYFLDFGKGIQAGKLSGSVAVSMRQNPKVHVRIMAWQYFPEQGTLVIGNPYSEGSRNAVARAMWTMRGASNGVALNRLGYQLVLQRAVPGDY
jgi:hypothetical protein